MPISCRVLLLLLAALLMQGCDKEAAHHPISPAESSQKNTIGVSLLTLQHQFYQELRAGLESKAAEYGYRLVIVSAEFDPSRQANQIDEFIVQKVSAIVVSPCDSRSVGASIAVANQANIPVFTADIANLSLMGKVVSHIASDNVQGGREAAKLLAKAISNKGKVAILSHPEVASVSDRVKGFKEQLAAYSEISVVAELSADGRRDKAVRVTEDLLESHPDLAGIFGINDDTALGALAAIEAAGKAGKIQIVGYDATPEARSKIANGALYGDVIQSPRRIGELTMQAIHDFFSGKTPPSIIAVEVSTYTGDRK
jgi:ribose transport system substrate-binding protein